MRSASLIAGLFLVLIVAQESRAQRSDPYAAVRNQMVDAEIVTAGVQNERVLESMRTTPRHEFMPEAQRQYAYYDMAVAIGEEQTISPPFIVAYMTEQIDPQPEDKVLEIGTGSGYQAAVLSPLVKEVYSIEIVEPLGRRAARTLRRLGYENVHTMVGDGFLGWPEHAPFDKIIVTCSPEDVPQALVDQLAEGGMMVVPVGERYQQVLYLFTKTDGQLEQQALRPTLFVPMTGAAEENRDVQPDPTKPRVVNGSFEEELEDSGGPAGWHYQRQLTHVEDADDAPEGERYVTLKNAEPGRGARALQGFAIDPSHVAMIDLSASVRGRQIRPGQSQEQLPRVVITFYDGNRQLLGTQGVGPYLGDFDWRRDAVRIIPPFTAREAILRFDMMGATGEFSIDNIEMTLHERLP